MIQPSSSEVEFGWFGEWLEAISGLNGQSLGGQSIVVDAWEKGLWPSLWADPTLAHRNLVVCDTVKVGESAANFCDKSSWSKIRRHQVMRRTGEDRCSTPARQNLCADNVTKTISRSGRLADDVPWPLCCFGGFLPMPRIRWGLSSMAFVRRLFGEDFLISFARIRGHCPLIADDYLVTEDFNSTAGFRRNEHERTECWIWWQKDEANSERIARCESEGCNFGPKSEAHAAHTYNARGPNKPSFKGARQHSYNTRLRATLFGLMGQDVEIAIRCKQRHACVV